MIAIGAEWGVHNAIDASGHGTKDLGLLWRFGHPETGWGWEYGFNWYAEDLQRSLGGSQFELGELHVKPFMAGYGYHYVIGRTTISAEWLGGFALTSMTLTPAARAAYRDRLGVPSVSADVANTFAMKPEVGVWYDLSRKVGLSVRVAYMLARPEVTVHTALGADRSHVRADMVTVKIGTAFRLF